MHFIGKNMLETILSDSQEMHISLPQSKVTSQNQIVLILNLYLILILKMCTFSHTIKSVYGNCKYLIIQLFPLQCLHGKLTSMELMSTYKQIQLNWNCLHRKFRKGKKILSLQPKIAFSANMGGRSICKPRPNNSYWLKQ